MTTTMTAINAADRMNRQYRFQRHIYDVTRTHYLAWRRRLVDELKAPEHGTIVEIACGTGWNLIRIARTYPTTRLFGADISREMLATARAKIDAAGLTSRVKLAEGDGTRFDPVSLFGVADADRVVISYALSMIPDWPAAIDRAAAALAPAGELHIVDFGRMEGMPAAAKWAFRRWLKHYNVTPRDRLHAALREAAQRHGLELTFNETPRGYAAYGVMRRVG